MEGRQIRQTPEHLELKLPLELPIYITRKLDEEALPRKNLFWNVIERIRRQFARAN